MKISVRQVLLKEAGPKEGERSSGLNYNFAKNELVRSGSEVSDKLIDIYYKQNKDKLPISDSDLSKDDALEVAGGEDEVSLVNSIFDLCDEWVASIPSDSSKVTIAVPW